MLLTVVAIAWGTLSIVMLLSFGEGMKLAFHKGTRGMGENIGVLWPGSTTRAYAGMGSGRSIQFQDEDGEMLVARIPSPTGDADAPARAILSRGLDAVPELLDLLNEHKPSDRSEKDRLWAIMRTDAQQGILLNIIVGIVGAFLAGLVLSPLLGVDTINSGNFSLMSLLVSLIGAVILLGIVNLFRRGATR